MEWTFGNSLHICKNCQHEQDAHLEGGKCLFGPTNYEPQALYSTYELPGLGIGNMNALDKLEITYTYDMVLME